MATVFFINRIVQDNLIHVDYKSHSNFVFRLQLVLDGENISGVKSALDLSVLQRDTFGCHDIEVLTHFVSLLYHLCPVDLGRGKLVLSLKWLLNNSPIDNHTQKKMKGDANASHSWSF